MTSFENRLFSLDQNIAERLDQLDQQAFEHSDPAAYRTGQLLKGGIQQLPIDAPGNDLGSPAEDADSEVDISQTQTHGVEVDGTTLWLSGSALLCGCPECGAPMTVRLWLGLADCWRCETSISLSEAQLQAAQNLSDQLRQELPVPRPAVRDSLPVPPPESAIGAALADLDSEPDLVRGRDREFEQLARGSRFARMMRRGLNTVPAWLVSFLLHIVLILILALIWLGRGSYLPESITLSTFLSSEREEGGDVRIPNRGLLQDDLDVASSLPIEDRELRAVLEQANRDAVELQVDDRPVVPLPNLEDVKRSITTAEGTAMSFAARDPRVRSEIVRKQGGTTVTEAAVARGLRWLASVQNRDGGWSLADYRRHNSPSNESDVMATSLALLPMLGAGQTHEFGKYKECVAGGLAWLLKNQRANGDLRAGYTGNPGMYAHGQATIVLCEALALTGDQKFVEPAQRALRFIEAAQHGKGGWRYQPGQQGDTSVFGWQMMALQSAKASGSALELDDSTLKLADYFLDQVTAPARFDNRRRTRLPDGAAYAYLPGRDATPTMTAEAILCRMYLGWKKNDPRLDAAVKWLVTDHLPSRRDPNLYYWYYGTQVMHHYGGEPWETWNDQMRRLLISSQETRGSYPGSWDPQDFEWGPRGGRIYTTSLAVCTLEVYYRHLPIFEPISLDR